MIIRDMTEDECRAVLRRSRIGRLGCARDNQPYVLPISFTCDGHYVFGFSTPGQKIDWMRANPHICLEVDERTSMEHWTSVVMLGRFEELPNTPEFAAARAEAQHALARDAGWWEYTAIPAAEWRRKSEPFTPIFYRLHIDKLTGHRATPAATT
jgi:nitroimidazol reductase NimA-like FMN-containing flavoprotein (pyridoxamine 5'-phosphate oxidase superfamily)